MRPPGVRTSGLAKSATAFRTISEVSAELDVPQHVLRFWEGKFPQIRPLKRGGGRRYYRPEDVELLRRIQSLLYKEGYTIKGVQRLLKEGRAAAEDDSDEEVEANRRPEPAGGTGSEDDSPAAAAGQPAAPEDDPGPANLPELTHAGLSDSLRREIVLVLDELKSVRTLLDTAHPKKGSFIA